MALLWKCGWQTFPVDYPFNLLVVSCAVQELFSLTESHLLLHAVISCVIRVLVKKSLLVSVASSVFPVLLAVSEFQCLVLYQVFGPF